MNNLQELIAEHKGPRSYRELAENTGGRIDMKVFHSLATHPTTRKLPVPSHIEGVASALNLPIRDVVLAAAKSAGLNPEPIPNVDDLNEQLFYHQNRAAAYKTQLQELRARIKPIQSQGGA